MTIILLGHPGTLSLKFFQTFTLFLGRPVEGEPKIQTRVEAKNMDGAVPKNLKPVNICDLKLEKIDAMEKEWEKVGNNLLGLPLLAIGNTVYAAKRKKFQINAFFIMFHARMHCEQPLEL